MQTHEFKETIRELRASLSDACSRVEDCLDMVEEAKGATLQDLRSLLNLEDIRTLEGVAVDLADLAEEN